MKNQLKLINSMLPNKEPLREAEASKDESKVEQKPVSSDSKTEESDLGKRATPPQTVQSMFEKIQDKQPLDKKVETLTAVAVQPISAVKKLDKKQVTGGKRQSSKESVPEEVVKPTVKKAENGAKSKKRENKAAAKTVLHYEKITPEQPSKASKTSKKSSKQSNGKDSVEKPSKKSQDTAETPAKEDCKTKVASAKKDNAKGRKSSKGTSSVEPAPTVEVKTKSKKAVKVIEEKPAAVKSS